MTGHPPVTALRDHAAGAAPDLGSHLRECPACTAVVEAERRLFAEIDAVIGQAGAAEPSPALLVRARSLADVPRWTHRVAPVVWAIAASLLLGVFTFVLQRVASTPAAAPVPAAVHTPAIAVPEPPPVTPVASSRPSPLPVRSSPTAVGSLPVVPPGQEAALVRFAELMASGTLIVPARLPDAEARSALIAEPHDLDRPLMHIEPIAADEAPSEE